MHIPHNAMLNAHLWLKASISPFSISFPLCFWPWNTRNYTAKCKRYIYYYNQEWAFSVSNLIFTFSQFFFKTASTQDMLCGSNIISPPPKFIILIVIVVFIDIQSRVGWWLVSRKRSVLVSGGRAAASGSCSYIWAKDCKTNVKEKQKKQCFGLNLPSC